MNQAGADRVVRHPLRIRVVTLLAQNEKMSTKQLSDVLKQPIGAVAYHIRLMYDLGALDLVGTGRKRGAIERFYALNEASARLIKTEIHKMMADGLTAEEALDTLIKMKYERTPA